MRTAEGFTVTSGERGKGSPASRPGVVGSHARRAFTLVELIVVVAIIAFIA